MKDKEKIELLRDILLKDDRKVMENLSNNYNELNTLINSPKELDSKVSPIIQNKLEEFQKKIPETLGPEITAALDRQIRESQNQVVDILYPIIGKMVGKYIRREFEQISERIDKQFEDAFSFDVWWRRLKAWWSGTKESELIISSLDPPALLELFVIEKDSGLLKKHYAVSKTLDADMVAGMLTAIKSFVEEAFSTESQDLESISYDNYKIQLINFKSFYIASVVSGTLNAQFKANLYNFVMDFAQKYLESELGELSEPSDIQITKQLKQYFNDSNF